MTQEEKELLLKDLCARVPYHPKGLVVNACTGAKCEEWLTCATFTTFMNVTNNCRLYLRPMSSMTEEEWKELNCIGHIVPLYDGCFGVDIRAYCKNDQPHYRRFSDFSTIEDWLNANHFDYRGLIEKGLALEAQDGMYNIKEYNKI